MSRPMTIALATLAWLLVSGCGDENTAPAGAEGAANATARGASVYQAKCALCHSSGMFGARPLAESLRTAVERVRDLEQHVAALRASDPDHHASRAEALDAVLALEGDARFEAWLRAYLADPRFDRSQSKMQAIQLDRRDEDALVAWLMAQRP